MIKKLFLILVFILSLVTMYDYYNMERTINFIPISKTLYQGKDVSSNFDDPNTFDLKFVEGSTIQAQIVNRAGNVVIISKKDTTDNSLLYFQEFDRDWEEVYRKEIVVRKVPNMIYPERENKVILLKQTDIFDDGYMIVTNRAVIYFIKNSPTNTYNMIPEWLLSATYSNGTTLKYFIETTSKIVTNFGSFSMDTYPAGDSWNLPEEKILFTNGGVVSVYSELFEKLWEIKYLELENEVSINEVKSLSDGNILLVGSYHDINNVTFYQAFNKPQVQQSIRNGVIIKLDSETGKIIWEKQIKGFNNDKIDLLSAVENTDGQIDVFGYYDISAPTLFFSIHLSKDGEILGEKVFEFVHNADIVTSDNESRRTTYANRFASLYLDDVSPYNHDSIVVFGNRINDGPFIITYNNTDYQKIINYHEDSTFLVHNIILLTDITVCGLFVIYIIYHTIKKFDFTNKRKIKGRK